MARREPPNEYEKMMAKDGPTVTIEVQREIVEEGRSFSAEALDHAAWTAKQWIGSRVMRRWNETGEPPTACKITVTVEVQ